MRENLLERAAQLSAKREEELLRGKREEETLRRNLQLFQDDVLRELEKIEGKDIPGHGKILLDKSRAFGMFATLAVVSEESLNTRPIAWFKGEIVENTPRTLLREPEKGLVLSCRIFSPDGEATRSLSIVHPKQLPEFFDLFAEALSDWL